MRLQRNNQQINQRIYRLIIDFEEEETAYLWERMQAREQVRRSSLVILGSVAAGSLLVMLLFVGILWRDVNRSNRYKRQLEAANRHNEALLEAREKLMLTITHDITPRWVRSWAISICLRVWTWASGVRFIWII